MQQHRFAHHQELNIDYNSEQDFIKKFKIVNSIVPISIALFANSSIVEKKNSGYLSYRSKVWQNTSRGGLPKLFFEELNFEKYAEFVMNFPILFIQNNDTYISGQKYIFKDFMNGFDIVSWEWDFDDGVTSNDGGVVAHAFDSPGAYKVQLFIADN